VLLFISLFFSGSYSFCAFCELTTFWLRGCWSVLMHFLCLPLDASLNISTSHFTSTLSAFEVILQLTCYTNYLLTYLLTYLLLLLLLCRLPNTWRSCLTVWQSCDSVRRMSRTRRLHCTWAARMVRRWNCPVHVTAMARFVCRSYQCRVVKHIWKLFFS